MEGGNDTYLTRETLIKKLRYAEEQNAWDEFVYFYQRFIYGTINKMGVPSADSDDLLQKVLLKIWKNIPKFEPNQRSGAFRRWISVITKNTVYNFFQSQQSNEKKKNDLNSLAQDESGHDPYERIIEEEWKKNIISLAFKNISNKIKSQHISIFKLSSHGYSVRLIAKELGLPEHKVYRYKKRVEQLLTQEIKALKEMLE